MYRFHRAAFAFFIAFAALLTGCTEDPLFPEKPISVSAPNLPRLDGDAYYELWFSYPAPSTSGKGPQPDHSAAEYFSVGKFMVDESGSLVGINGGGARFAIPTGYNPNLIIDAILTVESSTQATTDTLPGPRLLAGPFLGTQSRATARLEANDGEALAGKMFGDTVGKFSLVAATSEDPADSVSGIWFVIFRGADTARPGMLLAPQPLNPDNPDWTYQAWLIRNEGKPEAEYIKLGRFLVSTKPDSTGAGPGAGPLTGGIFQAPGEDFVTGARRILNDGTYGVAISVEPKGIELRRPLVPILKMDSPIPAGTRSRDSLLLWRPFNPPYLEVTVDR